MEMMRSLMEDQEEAGRLFDAADISEAAGYERYQDMVGRGEGLDWRMGDYMMTADQITQDPLWFQTWADPLKLVHTEMVGVMMEKTSGLMQCTLKQQGDVATAAWRSAGCFRRDQSNVLVGTQNQEAKADWKRLTCIKVFQILIPGAVGMEQVVVSEMMRSGYANQVVIIKLDPRFALFRGFWGSEMTFQILEKGYYYSTSMQNGAHHAQWGDLDAVKIIKKLNAIKDALKNLPEEMVGRQMNVVTTTTTSMD